MEIIRFLENTIREKLNSKKAIILIGARQVGKTTLLKKIFEGEKKMLWMNGDEMDIQAIFATISATRLNPNSALKNAESNK